MSIPERNIVAAGLASCFLLFTTAAWCQRAAELAGVVIDPKEGKVKEQVFDETNTLGADIVIEAVGRTETIEQAFDLAKRGGRVIIFGFAPEGQKATFIPFNVLSRELTIMGAWVNPYSYSRALDVRSSRER